MNNRVSIPDCKLSSFGSEQLAALSSRRKTPVGPIKTAKGRLFHLLVAAGACSAFGPSPTTALRATNQNVTFSTGGTYTIANRYDVNSSATDDKLQSITYVTSQSGVTHYPTTGENLIHANGDPYYRGNARDAARYIAGNVYIVNATTPVRLETGYYERFESGKSWLNSNVFPMFLPVNPSYSGAITADYALKFTAVGTDAAGKPLHTFSVGDSDGIYSLAFRWMASNYYGGGTDVVNANLYYHVNDFAMTNFIIDGGANPAYFRQNTYANNGSNQPRAITGSGRYAWYEFVQVDYQNMDILYTTVNGTETVDYTAYNRPNGTGTPYNTAATNYDLVSNYPLRMDFDNSIFQNFHNSNDGGTVMTVGRDAYSFAYITGNITFKDNWNSAGDVTSTTSVWFDTEKFPGAGVLSAGRGDAIAKGGRGFIVFEGSLLFDSNYSYGRAGAVEVYKDSRIEFLGETIFQNNLSRQAAGAVYLGYYYDPKAAGASSLRFGANSSFIGNHSENSAGAIYVYAGKKADGTVRPSSVEIDDGRTLTFEGNYVSSDRADNALPGYDASIEVGRSGALAVSTASKLIVGVGVGVGVTLNFSGNYAQRLITNSSTDSTSHADTRFFTPGAGAVKIMGASEMNFYGTSNFNGNYSYIYLNRPKANGTFYDLKTDAGAISVGEGSSLIFSGSAEFQGNYSKIQIDEIGTYVALNSLYHDIRSASGVFEIGKNSKIEISGNVIIANNYSTIEVANETVKAKVLNHLLNGGNLHIGAGVLELEENSRLEIKADLTFQNNWSGGSGGVIQVSGTNAAISFEDTADVLFMGNHATKSGGAIFMGNPNTSLQLDQAKNVLFQENYVVSGGGTSIYDNNGSSGGAIAIVDRQAHLTNVGNTSFEGNYVINRRNDGDKATALGGAVYVGGTGVNAEGVYSLESSENTFTTFMDNSVYSEKSHAVGGAIAITAKMDQDYKLDPGSANIIHSRLRRTKFEGNHVVTGTADKDALGGALFINTGKDGALVGTLFIGDNSTEEETTFINNYAGSIDGVSAKALGGAIYINEGVLNLSGNVVFAGNKQGVIFDENTNPDLPPTPRPSTGVSNAIYFAKISAGSSLIVDNATGKNVRFYDNIAAAANHAMTIIKTGEGEISFFNVDISIKTDVTVNQGFFRLGLDKGLAYGGTIYGDPAASSLAFNALDGVFNVQKSGMLIGEAGVTLTSSQMHVKENGRVMVRGGSTTGDFVVKMADNNFDYTAKDANKPLGGFGGHGTLRIQNLSGNPLALVTTGEFAVDVRHFVPEDLHLPDADAVFMLKSPIVGKGILYKVGAGTFVVENTGLNTYTSGGNASDADTLIQEGRILINSGAQTLNHLGIGTIFVNKWQPIPAGDLVDAVLDIDLTSTSFAGNDYAINNTLGSWQSGRGTALEQASGLISVNLAKTDLLGANGVNPGSGILTTTDTKDFDGTLHLRNLYFQATPSGGGDTTLAKTRIIVGTGTLLEIAQGTTEFAQFIFNGGAVRFTNVGNGTGTTASKLGSNISNTGLLEFGASGNPSYVQINNNGTGPTNLGDLSGIFVNNDTPLLLRDTYGILRQLISASGVTGDVSNIKLRDHQNAAFEYNNVLVDLVQNGSHTGNADAVVAKQYLQLNENSLNTGFDNKGLYISAKLTKLALKNNQTTLFDLSSSHSTQTGYNEFSVPIVSDPDFQVGDTLGRLWINAGSGKIILSSSGNTYLGETVVKAGTLKGGVANAIALSTRLTLEADTKFETGDFPQKVQHLNSSASSSVVVTSAAAENTLTLDNSDSSSYSGTFSGNAKIEKVGHGELTIAGTNHTHSGDWQVKNGILKITGTIGNAINTYVASPGSTRTAFDKTIAVDTGATLNFASNTQVIAPSGIVNGTGNVTLTSGVLTVHGLISAPFAMNSGATLAGTGRITAPTISSGAILAPGPSFAYDSTAGIDLFTPIGTLKFGPESGTLTSALALQGITYRIDLAPNTPDFYSPASGTDSILVNGDVVIGTATALDLDLNFLGGTWQNSGKYKILESVGGTIALGNTSLTNFTINGTAWTSSSFYLADNRRVLELLLEDNGKSLYLFTRTLSEDAIYWDDYSPGAGTWNTNTTNKNWRPEDKVMGGTAADDVYFRGGDRVFFDGAHPGVFSSSKIIDLPDASNIVVSQMLSRGELGKTVDITFTGVAKIVGRTSTDPSVIAAGGDGALTVGDYTRLTFNTTGGALFDKVYIGGGELVIKDSVLNLSTASSSIKVFNNGDNKGHLTIEGSGTLTGPNTTSGGYTADVYLGAPGTVFEAKNTGGQEYAGVITGLGGVLKSGTGDFILKGSNAYNGGTTVSGGSLTIKESLGTWTVFDQLLGTGTITTGTYAGDIEVSANATLAFNQMAVLPNSTQILSGEIKGSGTIVQNSSGKILRLDNLYSSGNPDITVTSGVVRIQGRLGVWNETFDQGTPLEMTYYHGRHTGDISIANSGTLIFDRSFGGEASGKPGSSYQILAGNLTGTPNAQFFKLGSAPVYIHGGATGYQGKLNVQEGTFGLHPSASGTGVSIWGTSGSPSSEIVIGTGPNYTIPPPILEVSPGVIHAKNFLLKENGTIRVITGGGVKISPSDASSVVLSPGARFIFDLNAISDASTSLPTGKLEMGVSTTANASGATGGVVFPASAGLQLNFALGWDYSQKNYILIGGLDLYDAKNTYSILGSLDTSVSTAGLELASKIFGINASNIVDKTGTYQLWFSSNGQLILTGLTYAVPEPSTYGLLGGAILLGLIAWRRRRNQKQKAEVGELIEA
jgi:autotransporter-associated beta strand protein/predicted outer membrane repeat protein